MKLYHKTILAAGLLSIANVINTYAQVATYLDKNQPIENRVQDALSRMTLEEKVALTHAQSKFSSPGVPRLGIPDLWWSDGPHGVRAEVDWNSWNYANWTNDSITAYPALTCLAATWNPELSYEYGNALGQEARYRKKDVILGPGVNIYRHPLNGRNFEYMGEDPYLASIMVVPYIKGVQQNGVATSTKHYVLNDQEKWRGHINVELSDRALHEIYLPAFKAAIVDGGGWTIMGAYNKVRGQHACHNELLLNDILKGDWGFDGVVVTDWGGAHDTKEAALNGLDVEMGSYTNGLTSESEFGYNNYYLADNYLAMLKSGEVPESTVNDKAARVLRLIFRTSMNSDRPWGSQATQEHAVTARKVGEEGIVLLRNEPISKKGAKLLPIDESKYNKILVVGENATRSLTQGGGSSELKVKEEISPLQGLQAKYGDKIMYAKGYMSGKSMYGRVEEIPQTTQDSLRVEAVAMAKDADLIIYVGGLNKNHEQDCEAGDRITYGLPFGQNKLIEELIDTNPNIVINLLSGNAVEMPWVNRVPAILQSWYLGSQAGNALTHVLSGQVNPSGKLPFSFPVKLTDNGAIHYGEQSYPGDSINQTYLEDILVGYRWHDTKKIPALYSFGYGLSYTTFAFGKAEISNSKMTEGGSVTVSISVKNTGDKAGKEVVQLYIKDKKSSLVRPEKELKGFQKVSLQPGEETTVHFTITAKELSFYNDQLHKWVAEPGYFEALIGASSTDIKGKVTFELTK